MAWALATTAAVICVATVVWMHHPSSPAPLAEQNTANANVPAATATAFDAAAPTDFLLSAASESNTPSVQELTSEINTLLNP